jgi:hypothetical protein
MLLGLSDLKKKKKISYFLKELFFRKVADDIAEKVLKNFHRHKTYCKFASWCKN